MSDLFTPIFLLILVAILIAVGMLVTGHVLGPRRETAVKQMPYESGMNPIGDARQRFDVRYYLVAIEFLIFDVEVLFLYPWAVSQWGVRTPMVAEAPAASVSIPAPFQTLAFLGILVFLALLVAGFAYSWRKGVYSWR